MNNKGDLIWDNITSWIWILIFAVVVLILIYLNKEKMTDLIQNISNFLKFGGT